MDEEYEFDDEALIRFIRRVAEARELAEVNVAAGVLLQDLGEEPSDG